MTQPRVLHLLWSGHVGGAERAVYQLVSEASKRTPAAVGVAFGRAQGPYYDAIAALGCEVIDLRLRGGDDLVGALRSANRLRAFEIHHFHGLEPSQIVASARCKEATRVFTQRHGVHGPGDSRRKELRRAFAGMMLRRYLHALSGNTQHATDYAVARYHLQHLPSRVTYNGIDFSLLVPRRARSEVRNELGAKPGDLVVGSAGKLIALKRFERLVNLLEHRPDLRVVLLGDGGRRSMLEAQAGSIGARDRLRLTGMVDDVASYLQAFDVFVLPSTADESFGNAVVEAMALGIPSIVFSDSPGLCEHIEDGVTGFVAKDQAELVSTVERLRADPELRARVGTAGARHVRTKYTLENMYRAYEELYEVARAGNPVLRGRRGRR